MMTRSLFDVEMRPSFVVRSDSYLVLKRESDLVLRCDSGSYTWNTKVALETSERRYRMNVNVALGCVSHIDWVEIYAANPGHWMAYKKLRSFNSLFTLTVIFFLKLAFEFLKLFKAFQQNLKALSFFQSSFKDLICKNGPKIEANYFLI